MLGGISISAKVGLSVPQPSAGRDGSHNLLPPPSSGTCLLLNLSAVRGAPPPPIPPGRCCSSGVPAASIPCLQVGASIVSVSSPCRQSWSGRNARSCSLPVRGWPSTDTAREGAHGAERLERSAGGWSMSAVAAGAHPPRSARSCGASRSWASMSRSGGLPSAGPMTMVASHAIAHCHP